MNVFGTPQVRRVLTAFLIAQLIALGLLGLGAGVLFLPPVQAMLGEKVAELAREKLSRAAPGEELDIHIAGAQPRPRSLRLEGVELTRHGKKLASFQSLVLSPDMEALLDGQLQLASVVGRGFSLTLPDPTERAAASDALPDRSAEASSSPAETLQLDRRVWLETRMARASRFLDPEGFDFRLREGTVALVDSEGRAEAFPLSFLVAIWPTPGKLPLKTSVGLVTPDGLGSLDVDVSISADADQLLARVSGPGYPLERLRARLESLAPAELLEKARPLLERLPYLPSLGGDFTLTWDLVSRLAVIEGDVVASDVFVDEPRVSLVPFGPLEVAASVKVELEPDKKRVNVERWRGRVNKILYDLNGKFELRDDHGPISLGFSLDNLPYQDIVESFPPELIPAVGGVRLGGSFDLKVQVVGDVYVPQDLAVDYFWDFSRLKLEVPSEPLRGPEPLRGFVYRPVSKDGEVREFLLGREQPGWVPIGAIPNHVIQALLLSEDSDFYQHEGFDTEGIKLAIKTNLKAGKPLRGGSTITQQLAKNLFLTRERTALRKLQEAVLAWELEQVFEKRQILELYLNVIEWGPGFYGIGRAAQHYFGKSASELTVKEGAYLCTIIPNPVRYYHTFTSNELSVYWGQHLQALLNRMRAFERISEEEYQLASGSPLYFRDRAEPAVDLYKLIPPEEEGTGEVILDGEGEAPPEEEEPIFSLPQLRFTP